MIRIVDRNLGPALGELGDGLSRAERLIELIAECADLLFAVHGLAKAPFKKARRRLVEELGTLDHHPMTALAEHDRAAIGAALSDGHRAAHGTEIIVHAPKAEDRRFDLAKTLGLIIDAKPAKDALWLELEDLIVLFDDLVGDERLIDELKLEGLAERVAIDGLSEVRDHRPDALHLHINVALLAAARSHKDELLDALGIIEREADGDGAAHGVADEAHLCDAEMIEEAERLLREIAHIVGTVFGLIAIAIAKEIGDDRAEAARVQEGIVPLEIAIAAGSGSAPMEEKHGAIFGLAIVMKMDGDAAADLGVFPLGDDGERLLIRLLRHFATFGLRGGWKRCPHSLI